MIDGFDEADYITLAARERIKRIYHANPAKKIAQVGRWQRENRDKVNEKQRRYYERKRAKEKSIKTL